MIYLDYQATTPLAPEALAAMLPWLERQHANPHSAHPAGRAARAAVEVAREQVAALLPRGGTLSFTSGATEALNWAIKGVGPGRIVTIATEHAAVLDTIEALRHGGRDVVLLPVDAEGMIDLQIAGRVIEPGTALVAAMLVNNEIGVIQPIAALADIAHSAGAMLLCDAVQGYGRVAIPDTVDMIAISAHKIYGPKGIGALWLRDGITINALMHGGGQETAGRSGTLSPALCAGFGAAAQLMAERKAQDDALIGQYWQAAMQILGNRWTVNGSTDQRYRGNINIRRDGIDVARLMSDCRDIAFSAGSACASGSGRTSHVLEAMGLTIDEAKSSIRLGFGRYTTKEELVTALNRIDAAARSQELVP